MTSQTSDKFLPLCRTCGNINCFELQPVDDGDKYQHLLGTNIKDSV
jgi:hypothetical protein